MQGEKDFERFNREFTAMHAMHYPESAFSPALTVSMFDRLSSYSVDEVIQALNDHVMNPDRCRWMPKPGDIVGQIEARRGLLPDDAWEKLVGAVRDCGSVGNPELSQAAEAFVESRGGWQAFCATLTVWTIEQTRKAFLASYRNLDDRHLLSSTKHGINALTQ